MPALSDARLRAVLLGALPEAEIRQDEGHTKPIVLELPEIGPVRIYLWTTTPDQSVSGRPLGEHKAQIILPGSERGSRQRLDVGDMTTALLGYSPVFGVFTAWQAELHANSGYSKNLQFREEMLDQARAFGWAVGEIRRTDNGPEVRVGVHPLHLFRYLKALQQADSRRLSGEERRAFMLAQSPVVDSLSIEQQQIPEARETERRRLMSSRLSRSSRFANEVLADYGNACAVCSLQLSIVVGAHIIPVHDERSIDERWNGICFCPNHHSLYDSRILRIDREALVRVSEEDIRVLRDLNLLEGYDEALRPFLDRQIRLPEFFSSDETLRNRMMDALHAVFLGASAN